MAFDAFLIFYGENAGAWKIEGESTDPTYGNPKMTAGGGSGKAFEVSEFSFGAETTLSIGSGTTGAGAGKATFKEFTVKKLVDKCSPALLKTLGSGGHYDKVKLFIRKAGGDKTKTGKAYLNFCFGMVAVKSLEWSGSSGDDVPTETVVFEYGELHIGYFAQTKGGQLDTQCQTGGWSKLYNISLPGSPSEVTDDDVKGTP